MLLSFRKIWTLVAVSAGNSFVYRGSFLIRLLILFISLGAQFFFWHAAFQDRGEVVDYTFSSFFSYLLLANLIYEILQPNNVMISTQIREGSLSPFLLLPYRFMNFIFWKLVGDRLAFLLVAIIPVLVTVLLFRSIAEIDLPITFLNVALLIFYLPAGLFLHFLIDFGIGQFAFWFERSEFLFIVKEIALRILAGLWFPFQILPLILQKAFSWLPFQFLGYVPAKAFLDPTSVSWRSPLLLLGWIGLLYFLNLFIWKAGIKKYEAFGG